MIMENEPNIREVITFPKTGDGKDLMIGRTIRGFKRTIKGASY